MRLARRSRRAEVEIRRRYTRRCVHAHRRTVRRLNICRRRRVHDVGARVEPRDAVVSNATVEPGGANRRLRRESRRGRLRRRRPRIQFRNLYPRHQVFRSQSHLARAVQRPEARRRPGERGDDVPARVARRRDVRARAPRPRSHDGRRARRRHRSRGNFRKPNLRRRRSIAFRSEFTRSRARLGGLFRLTRRARRARNE